MTYLGMTYESDVNGKLEGIEVCSTVNEQVLKAKCLSFGHGTSNLFVQFSRSKFHEDKFDVKPAKKLSLKEAINILFQAEPVLSTIAEQLAPGIV